MGYIYELVEPGNNNGVAEQPSAANYSALPPAADEAGFTYFVENSQGTAWLPGSLGGTYYPRGLYYSNGIEWLYQENPGQATQGEADAGIIDDKFISPNKLANLSKWATKENVLVAGTNITINRTNPLAPVISASGTGGGEVIVLQTRAPLATDDSSSGYFVGQRWVDIRPDELRSYLAQDVTNGAAVWKEITPVGGISTGSGGEVIIESGVSLGIALTQTVNSNTDNLVVTDIEKAIVLRLDLTGNYAITGLVPFNTSSAWMLFLTNVGAGNLTIKNNDSGSLAENRFLIGSNKTLQSNESILLFYDPISDRWRGSGILI